MTLHFFFMKMITILMAWMRDIMSCYVYEKKMASFPLLAVTYRRVWCGVRIGIRLKFLEVLQKRVEDI